MISIRLAAGIAAVVLAVGILVGSAASILIGAGNPGRDAWGPGYGGVMGGSRMMGGSSDRADMRDLMREHMGWGDSQ